MREIRSTSEVAPGILFVEGPASNWTVFHGDGAVELVDCGYPADRPLVEASIRAAGAEPADLRRILITHGHSDHLGSSRELAVRHGAAVQTAAAELPNVRREVTEQVTVADLLPSVLKRGTVRWAVEAIRAGGLGDVGVPSATAFDGDTLELSTGHRLHVVATPGHTSGHACLFEPDARVLITGDVVVTGHALLRESGELQQLPAFFHHDVAAAAASARSLDLCDTAIVLPGHGPLLRL
ncbi:MBL fold metallo-hydrolase [Leifsonia sp. NPDC080035]|uniref:MBL fold metallo-hydrolase n=1 Tax=Leifsonia sp. NPDC080035 TaxID=3143936 RepID=A0AAU7GFX5_9MICO